MKELNYKQLFLLLVHGNVNIVQSSMRNWDWNHYLQIHKVVSDKTPSDLKNKFHRLHRPLHKYISSFFPGTITSWNNIITHFDDIPSFNDSSKEK